MDFLDFLVWAKTELPTALDSIKEQLMDLATAIAFLQAEDTELQQDFADFSAKLDDESTQIDALKQQITDLQNSGSGATPDQIAALQTLIADLDAIHQSAKSKLPTPPPFNNVRLTTDTGFPDYEARLFEYNAGKPADQQVPADQYLTSNADGTGTWDTMTPVEPPAAAASDPTGGAAALGTETSTATSPA